MDMDRTSFIQNVKETESGYLVNGNMSVPNDPRNSDYQAVQEWLAKGNFPDPTPPTPIPVLLDQLWQSATDYQERFIRAIDLLGYQRKQTGGGSVTRAMENVAWVDGIWADYYQRRAVIESGEDASNDFSNHGEPPWSYLECMEE